MMIYDWWQSFMTYIRRDGSSNTYVEWYWAPLGMDWIQVLARSFSTGGNYAYIHFTNSHTEMDTETGTRPLMQRWYDGLICRRGTTRIPAPGFSA
jgi:hypothetical protein